MTLRERSILISSLLAIIFLLWFFIFFLVQNSTIQETKLAIAEENKKTAELIQKRTKLELLIKDDTLQKLVAKFEHLRRESIQLEAQIAQYEQRFISDKELASLLFSMLKQTGGVSIEDFSNIDYIQGQQAKIISPEVVSSASGSTVQGAQPDLKVEASSNLVAQLPTERTQYKLILKGDYFSIVNYLEKLEQLEWQLYWDKLEYKVMEYPLATATIEFYTLKPVVNPPPVSQEVKK